MKNKITYIISILILGLCSACYEDFDNSTTAVNTEDPIIIIETDLIGKVSLTIPEDSIGLSLVVNDDEVSISPRYYQVQSKNIRKRNQHIELRQDGVMLAFANVPLIELDVNKVDIQGFPTNEVVPFDGELDLNLGNNMSLKMERDAFTSNETININFFSTIDLPLLNQMGLLGQNESLENLFLHAHSGFYVDAFSSSNVQLAKAVQLTIRALESNSLSPMGLFHYDKELAVWNLVDNLADGDNTLSIEDLGYFKISPYEPAVFIESQMELLDKALAYQQLSLNNNISVITTASGKWSSFLPHQEQISYTLSNNCNDVIQEFNLMTGTEDQFFTEQLDPVQSTAFIESAFISVDCNGQIDSNPSIRFNVEGQENIYSFINEDVDVWLPSCDEDTDIAAFDTDISEVVGTELSWNNDIRDDIGVLTECETLDEGFNYIVIEGQKEVFDSFNAFYTSDETILRSDDGNITFVFERNEVGDRIENEVNLYINDATFGNYGYFIDCLESDEGCGIDDFYVSHYDLSEDGIIRASFKGRIWAQRISTLEAGNFEIEGQLIVKI